MSVSPGTYNFTLQRRADYSLVLQLKGSNDAAINLTGATVEAQAWNKQRSTKYADFAIAYKIAENLSVQGLLFVGLDVIGNKVTEINITSPTCVKEIEGEYDINICGILLDAIEKRLNYGNIYDT